MVGESGIFAPQISQRLARVGMSTFLVGREPDAPGDIVAATPRCLRVWRLACDRDALRHGTQTFPRQFRPHPHRCKGEARMVTFPPTATERIAVAEGRVVMSKATLELIVSGQCEKGRRDGYSPCAGIMAAKRNLGSDPLCHPLALSKVTLDITPDKKRLPGCVVRATVKVTGPTGGRDGSLDRGIVACLTIYDMIRRWSAAPSYWKHSSGRKKGRRAPPP